MKKMNTKSGFTLIEIMIVVAIIIILATLAIPAFQAARVKSQASVCVNNLRQIDGAYDLYYLEEGAAPSDIDADLVGARLYIKSTPVCPDANGGYTLPSGGTNTICDIGDDYVSDYGDNANHAY